MGLKLRPGTPEDAEVCGRISYEAFSAIAREHGFPSNIPTPEDGVGVASLGLTHPDFYSVVAELDGQVVGSNFLDERSTISGVGPITISPATQRRGIGRALMKDVMRRADDRGAAGVRLLQAGYNNQSLSLYAKLGFRARDLTACMQGAPLTERISGYEVRPATHADVPDCAVLCRMVHGHDRSGEVSDAVRQGTAMVVEHDNRISGYATGLAFFAHAVGESNEDIKALIAAAEAFAGTGILVPVTNAELFEWCLDRGLRVVHTMTLMTTGLYNTPDGAYLPSVSY
jgi:GNAT superfamily N-acetyltransferase